MNAKEIQGWLITHVAELLHVTPDILDIHEPFANYGLSSRDAVTLSGDLEELLGRRLSPTLAYEYPSIALLSAYLGDPQAGQTPSPHEVSGPDILTGPIAIIGMGCRFPGAKDTAAFWQLLRNGVDAITEVPQDRWQKDAFYNPDPAVPGKSVSYWGGFLDQIDQFDPFFFGISPMEAKYMDPQQRLLLELSYEALDDAGQSRENITGTRTGVFIGISINEYSQLQLGDPAMITSHSGTGSALSIAANRISYFFDFRGPSMAIDTACSSSLAAVHLACQSLRAGECTMALAGGVNLILSPAHSIAFTKAGVLAPDGRCKAFDARANGYVRGEGGGIVVLKPLAAALADGDPVYALIEGSAMCQDGRTNGLMAPNREAQEALLQEAYHAAGISPGTVQYIETHGTGTLLGDSMEAAALGAVIGVNRPGEPCAIGTVKSNIGHLEAAAGIAGLIKVVLSLRHHSIPPSLHYQLPNPHVPFDELHLRVQDKLASWPSHSGPAMAGVSSFGFGGTIVHMVVRGADEFEPKESGSDRLDSSGSNVHLLPLSANSFEALQSMAGTFKNFISNEPEASLKDICNTAGLKRSQNDYRLAVIGQSRDEICNNLEKFLKGEADPCVIGGHAIPDHPVKLAFVFAGQGGQWHGMGQELLHDEPVFYQAIERIDQALRVHCTWSLMEILRATQSTSRLDEIDIVQPVIFAVQVALSELLRSWGILPDAVVGHSMGEVAAAHIAGALSLEDAARIICLRSQLLKKVRGQGSMLVTELTPVQADELIMDHKNINIAAINSPTSTVLSGDTEAIAVMMDFLSSQNYFCRLVNVDVASHSPQMDLLRGELLKSLHELHPRPSSIPIYSTVTGRRGNNLTYKAEYWMDNLRKPVLFSNAIGQLLEDGHSAFVEIGPHPILLGAIQQSMSSRKREGTLLPSLRRQEPERKLLLTTLGVLFTEGISIDWSKRDPNRGRSVYLPPIPWQRQRYWLDAISATSMDPWHKGPARGMKSHPLLGTRINVANSPSTYIWQSEINPDHLTFLKDHRIQDEIVLPGAAYMEMALQVAIEVGIDFSHELADFDFKRRMILQSGETRQFQTLLNPDHGADFTLSFYSKTSPEDQWVLHASARFLQHHTAEAITAHSHSLPDMIRRENMAEYPAATFYNSLEEHGLQYGPSFRAVEYAWQKREEALGRVALPESLQYEADSYFIHPALLDACLQVLAATQAASGGKALYIPAACQRIRFFSRPGRLLWSHVILHSKTLTNDGDIYADIRLMDENQQPVAELIGLQLRRVPKRNRRSRGVKNTWLYQVRWQALKDHETAPSIMQGKKQWLIFADDEGLGESLAGQLEQKGDSCHLLTYHEVIKNTETTDQADITELIERHLKETPSSLYGIIHLWSLSIPQPSAFNSSPMDSMQMPGCSSVLLLVQALAKRLAAMPRLWLVTRGAQAVKSGDQIAIGQSAMWGFGKGISFEFPELNCVRLDLDPFQTQTEAVSMLMRQVSTVDPEDQIAFRGNTRFVLRLMPFRLRPPSGSSADLLRGDSTYLITGGWGGLGLTTSKWMVQQGVRHLVLLGRSKPSEQAMSVIEQMRDEGAEVVIALADVSDPVQVENTVQGIRQDMPPLRGVIHAAGILDDGALLNLDVARMKSVMAPKVDGTWNLHRSTLTDPLDFFVLFSSVVSVLGSPGQGNYAAASAFLDALSYYRRQMGLPAISINWGPWADVGLAAEATERLKEQNASTQHLIKVIQLDEGMDILEQMLTDQTPQVAVLPFDLSNLLELYPTAAGMPFFKEVGGSDTQVARLYARPHLRQLYVGPRNEIERKLAELWRQTLHIDRVGVHDSFFELGGDSVLAAQILSLAQKTFGIRINPQDAFQAFTIERLAEMLEAALLRKIEEMSEQEAQQELSKHD